MNNKTNTYLLAVQTIREVVDETQARLDANAAEERKKSVVALRKAAVHDVKKDSPLYPVASLLAQTITVGREDGYPTVSFPETTRAVLVAALRAGIIAADPSNPCHPRVGSLLFHLDFSGAVNASYFVEADYQAWRAATEYRSAQIVSKL